MYTQTYTPTVVQEVCCSSSPGLLKCYNIFENILPLIDSLSRGLQIKVNIMGYWAAGGHSSHMAAILDFTKNSNLWGKRGNYKYFLL